MVTLLTNLSNVQKPRTEHLNLEVKVRKHFSSLLYLFDKSKSRGTGSKVFRVTMAFCLQDEILKPYVLNVIGIYIQFWVVTFITLKDGMAQIHPEETKSLNDRMPRKSFLPTAAVLFKNALRIWQIGSMAAIFFLDIRHFMNHAQLHSNESAWSQYNCYTEIMLSSSNFQNFWTNLSIVYIFWSNKRNGALWFYLPLNVLMAIVFVSIVPIFCTHIVPAIVCYCWFWIPFYLVYTACYLCCIFFTCFAFNPGHPILLCCFGIAPNVFDDMDEDQVLGVVELIKSPAPLSLLVVCVFMIPGLAQSYWYSEQRNYIESIMEALTERRSVQYFEHVFDESVSGFRFFTTIL